jgi:hypothetical protein
MRCYSADDEERMRTEAAVREWTRSGLLSAEQGAALAADVRVDLRRTNPFLRAALALFTAIIVAASVMLIVETLTLRQASGFATVAMIAAVVCFALAERLVALGRFYRFGVEEMLAVAAVVLASISVGTLMPSGKSVMPLAAGALGGLGLFLRFGFLYGAVGALVCTAAMPFQADASTETQRLLAAIVCVAAFAFSRVKTREHRDDFLRDDYAALQCAAWAGVYLVLNVKITPGWMAVGGWFYWWTYTMTWVLPPIGLAIGVRDREQQLIDVSILMLLATMVTSKMYLGWARNTWDPIVLGVVLIGAATTLRRWLASGPGGERSGFTAQALLQRDSRLISLIAASAAIQPLPAAHPAATGPSQFEGGRSGGAGGGAGY